jgi:hypothetical protein
VIQIPGEEIITDGFTKPLLVDKHARFVKALGLVAKAIPWKVYEEDGQGKHQGTED